MANGALGVGWSAPVSLTRLETGTRVEIRFPLTGVQVGDALALNALLLEEHSALVDQIPGASALKPAFQSHSDKLLSLMPQERLESLYAQGSAATLGELDDEVDRRAMGCQRLLESLLIFNPGSALSTLNVRLNLSGLANASYNDEVSATRSLDHRLTAEDWALMETLPGSTRDRTFKAEIDDLKVAGEALAHGLAARSGIEAVMPVRAQRAVLTAWRTTFKAFRALLIAAPESVAKAELVQALNLEFERIDARRLARAKPAPTPA